MVLFIKGSRGASGETDALINFFKRQNVNPYPIMKNIILALTLTAWMPIFLAAETKVATVAVFNFAVPDTEPSRGFARASGQTDRDTFGEDVASFLTSDLSNYQHLLLVEREGFQKLLAEQEIGAAGFTDAQTSARIGRLLGAQVFVSGRIVEIGSRSFLVSRVVGTGTGRVFSDRVEFPDRDNIVESIDALAVIVARRIENHYDELVPEPENPDAIIAKLAPLVEGVDLPSVSVSIPEEHLSRAIPDPAVETEFQRILLQLGFEVIDPKHSTRRPDIRIIGEAFSEVGARRGDLVACRARLEVQLISTSDGALLHADRETAVAVDVAEHVAAKEALSRTARQAVEAVVHKLISKDS